MATKEATIHLIKKDDITDHVAVPLSYTSPNLEDGDVLIRSVLVSLTANNMTYAHMGTIRNWWDTYPVPDTVPKPYNDPPQYGIVPVWGYAEILDSKTAGLATGDILFGFWPSHDMPVLLKLQAAGDCPGHYIEISAHRKNLMNLYNRCIHQTQITWQDLEPDSPRAEHLAWRTIFLEAGRYISRFIFGSPPIHPLGALPWSDEDADLAKAVVISLSASDKTARMFQDALVARETPTGPLGWLGITAAPQGSRLIPAGGGFATKVIAYQDVASPETRDWIESLKPERIVLVDFASRGTSLRTLVSALAEAQTRTMILGVGTESKPHTPSALALAQQTRMGMENRAQMNMSGIRDAAIEVLGAERVFEEAETAWEGFVERGGLEGMRLEWRRGVQGIERGWERLCGQSVRSDVGMVFRL